MEWVSRDVVVVGTGVAGLRAAIEAALNGLDVVVLTKTRATCSASIMAEGGVNAALANVDKDDSWEKHFIDTVRAGAFLNDQDLVEVLCKEIVERIYELEEWGAMFSRTDDGLIAQRAFGKQSRRRTCYASDRTGHEIVTTLLSVARSLGVEIVENRFASDVLLSDDGARAAGVLAWDTRAWEPEVYRSKAVILACGGAAQIYEVTTVPQEATGDCYAIALRAGLKLKDMEMVQFHPTGLAFPESAKGILITEAVRGEGGILRNALGERFMARYAPQEMELAGRDVVARAIWREISEGRGTEHGGVYLDITHVPCERIRERLESTYRLLRRLGIDMCREPIEVSPTAHYFMGGIEIDVDASTALKGLFACGEAAGGVHGANRVGGNSLAEGLVFGRRAGASASRVARSSTAPSIDRERLNIAIERVRSVLSRSREKGVGYETIRKRLRSVMWRYGGVVRSGEGLRSLIKELESLEKSLCLLGVDQGASFSVEALRALETVNMVLVARAVAVSALAREESRGAHYREDYPRRDDSRWLKHITVSLRGNAIVVGFSPVRITRVKP
ncbi:MAG: FAD-dependent oxidoreductase [Crenarchaeota archaeon]|nr:FAD-dependent oxidoreductase [Thermoproteota archaeon]